AVSLVFTGEGKRPVKVSYVVENPIWKTSYRLVLGKDGKPFLQGWAVVENPSDEDWNNVRMALISGRPISFQMDLYQPLYVPRPVVEPEVFASLRPQTYTDAMERKGESLPPPPAKKAEAGMGGGWGAAPALAAPAPAAKEAEKDMGRQMRRSVTFGAGKAAKTEFFREELGIDAGVHSAASAGNLGD